MVTGTFQPSKRRATTRERTAPTPVKPLTPAQNAPSAAAAPPVLQHPAVTPVDACEAPQTPRRSFSLRSVPAPLRSVPAAPLTPSRRPVAPVVPDPTGPATRLSRTPPAVSAAPASAAAHAAAAAPVMLPSQAATAVAGAASPATPAAKRPRGTQADKERDDLYELLDFLVRKRPAVAQPFIKECLKMYYRDFSRRQKARAEMANASNPAVVDLVRTLPNVAPSHIGPAVGSAPVQDENEVTVVPDANIQRSAEQLVPKPSAPPVPVETEQRLPPIDHPFYKRRDALANAAKSRWKLYKSKKSELSLPMTPDKEHYIIWGGADLSKDRPALLSVNVVRALSPLQDSSKQLPAAYSQALQFLWLYLVEDPCTGAVFSHSIGFPRIYIVLTFCHLLLNSSKKRKKKVLVLCPQCTMYQWRNAAEDYSQFLPVAFVDDEAWAEDVQSWGKRGGILVCSLDQYRSVIITSDSEDRVSAMKALVSPGPDIVLLDEASRLGTFDPAVRRTIARTRTKARLAISSSVLSGNLFRTWTIVDWATPLLFGSREEFWHLYVKRIATGHKHGSTISDGGVAYTSAKHLYAKLQQVSHITERKDRTNVLRLQGKRLRDVTLLVNMSKKQSELYKATASFLAPLVASDSISPFFALYVLQVITSSSEGLVAFLRGGAIEGSDMYKDQDMMMPLKSVKDVCSSLYENIKHLVGDGELSSKVLIVREILAKCVASREKLAIFACSSYVSRAIHQDLVKMSKNVFLYDLASDSAERGKQLDDFNKCQNGAVLIAPFGPTADCMEDAGWGHIDTRQVVVTDSCWNASMGAQAVDRVFNFQAVSTVCVYNLVTVGTVESSMQSDIEAFLSTMRAREDGILHQATIGHCAEQRAFLLPPEISPRHLTDGNFDFESARIAVPVGDDLNIDIDCGDAHGFSKADLQSLRIDGDGYALRSVTTQSSRYCAIAELLETTLRGPLEHHEEVKNENALTREIKSHIFRDEATATRGHRAAGLQKTQLDKLQNTFAIRNLFVEQRSRECVLLANWDPYFRLYEQQGPFSQQQDASTQRSRLPLRESGNELDGLASTSRSNAEETRAHGSNGMPADGHDVKSRNGSDSVTIPRANDRRESFSTGKRKRM